MRSRDLFQAIHTEGGLLPPDLLKRIADGDKGLKGIAPGDYHLVKGERLNELANRSWNRLLGAWAAFREAAARLDEGAPDAGITRERWLLILFQELGYGRLEPSRSKEIGGKTYPVSHFWGCSPIHLVGFRTDLDSRTKGVAGAARQSPHSMLQELLNRSEDSLWGFVSNGLQLRLLRDNASLTRQAYVEFDLESMMDGEVYADFALLWRLCHQSRVEVRENGHPESCWLEEWTKAAHEQGARALDQLRGGVEAAITALGRGFVAHPANAALKQSLRDGTLGKQDYYRQLLRLVYRLLFLFVAEDRDLLLVPGAGRKARERYAEHYSTRRLRRLAERRRGSPHPDLYRGLRLVMEKLGSDDGCPELALPALGSFLWSAGAIPDLAAADIANRDLLAAVRALAFTDEDRRLRAVDYRNLGSEELGSIYESLLELHPEVNVDAGAFELTTASGHERKTTGSYYTPSSLIDCLLDSALDPVLDEAAKKPNPEEAILGLKICDPACGSGHFLVAAAHRIAKRLAAVRSGDEEPSPGATRTALRDVIGHCIHGVDMNEMAVELCKVSLWMEALEPGKPLSFLDHRIVCGNSLLGTTPTLIAKGIPDDAFKPIEGDDKAVVSALRKQNKEERKGQMTMFAQFSADTASAYGGLARTVTDLDAIADDSIAGIHQKEERYRRLTGSDDYRRAKLVADAWCAAFVWKKVKGAPEAVTHDLFLRLQRDPASVPASVRSEIERLARQYRFLHWHLAFPEVFGAANGEQGRRMTSSERRMVPFAIRQSPLAAFSGFDVVLGNPPWERIKLQEQEWFASVRPEIAAAPNAAARKRLIDALVTEDPALHTAFLDARRDAEGESHLVRNSGRYPLCGRGDINTYAIFAETKRMLISPAGRVGTIVPLGIATDDTTKLFFQSLTEARSVVCLYGFENESLIFPGVHHATRFCLLTMSGLGRAQDTAEFAFFVRRVEDLRDEDRRFTLTAEDIGLLNPNTRTCPVFRTRRDAEITKAIYRRVPVLVREDANGERRIANRGAGEPIANRHPPSDPWGVSFLAMFHMANDSGLFRTREQLEAAGLVLEGNSFVSAGHSPLATRYSPLYEAKMIHHFDHRFGDYRDQSAGSQNTSLPDVPAKRLADPGYSVLPRYWVPVPEVDERLRDRWGRGWLLGWRDICRSTDERTVIASVLPRVGVGHTTPLFIFADSTRGGVALFQAGLSTFVLDFAARQKVGGTHLTYHYLTQFPLLAPSGYQDFPAWDRSQRLSDWLLPRVLELTFTAHDLAPFARDLGYDGQSFRWDEERRFLIRAELDAAFFHLYLPSEANGDWRTANGETEEQLAALKQYFPVPRDAVEHIMETFPIVKRKDIQKHGDYRTKLVILDIYGRMQRAIATGEPYETILDPPPGDPRAAHPARGEKVVAKASSVLPFRRVERPTDEEKYTICVPVQTLKAAAGGFSDWQNVSYDAWAEVTTAEPLRKGMFVAQVIGHSMEPLIPDCAWCLFRRPVLRIRDDMIALVQSRSISDPETGGNYTVKRIKRLKGITADGAEGYTAVRLEPLNPDYPEMVLPETGDEVQAIAEFVEVLPTSVEQESRS